MSAEIIDITTREAARTPNRRPKSFLELDICVPHRDPTPETDLVDGCWYAGRLYPSHIDAYLAASEAEAEKNIALLKARAVAGDRSAP